MSAEKLDLYRIYNDEYIAPKEPVFVRSLKAKFLTVTGRGEPGGAAFAAKVKALYAAAYAIKMLKKAGDQDFVLCKLEALWWGSREGADFSKEPRNKWNWKLMIRMPHFVRETDRVSTILALIEKGKDPAVGEIRLESIREGLCVQMLHVGPYDKEAETVAKMKAFAEANDHAFYGCHHEIYLSDPKRVSGSRLRTILRMPVR